MNKKVKIRSVLHIQKENAWRGIGSRECRYNDIL